MKLTLDKNNLKKRNSISDYSFTKHKMKTSKNIMDINEDNLNISNASLTSHTKKKKSSIISLKKGKTIKQMLFNEEINDNATSFGSHNLNNNKSKINLKISKEEDKKINKNIKHKKKVKFKDNFINVIEIESYKKYNVNNYFNNNNNSLKCSCDIF